jgi:hypothetical protein
MTISRRTVGQHVVPVPPGDLLQPGQLVAGPRQIAARFALVGMVLMRASQF